MARVAAGKKVIPEIYQRYLNPAEKLLALAQNTYGRKISINCELPPGGSRASGPQDLLVSMCLLLVLASAPRRSREKIVS
jgi:hypothetical protein